MRRSQKRKADGVKKVAKRQRDETQAAVAAGEEPPAKKQKIKIKKKASEWKSSATEAKEGDQATLYVTNISFTSKEGHIAKFFEGAISTLVYAGASPLERTLTRAASLRQRLQVRVGRR